MAERDAVDQHENPPFVVNCPRCGHSMIWARAHHRHVHVSPQREQECNHTALAEANAWWKNLTS